MATSTYRQRRAQGLCGRCGATPLPNKAMCEICTIKCREVENWRPNRAEARRKLAAIWKLSVLSHYGGAICKCCGERNLKFLTLDHIDGGGKEHRKQAKGTGFYRWLIINDFPPCNLQVLCYNCNCGREKNGGICPHKEENIYRIMDAVENTTYTSPKLSLSKAKEELLS